MEEREDDTKTAIWQFITSQQHGFEKVDFAFLNEKLASNDPSHIQRICKEGARTSDV